MRRPTTALRAAGLATMAAVALTVSPVASSVAAAPAPESAVDCHVPSESASAKGGRHLDHEEMSPADVARVEAQTKALLAKKQGAQAAGGVGTQAVNVPVYVHVMAAANGAGNVTDTQISQQIAVLNRTFGGQESSSASNTGFTFTLAGTDRFFNNRWHNDQQSSTYRTQTRRGGFNALNIWLVDFDYLGIATFPWSGSAKIDGIRVHYDSLPGGSIANYNLGETATHEAGHWLGLYHTFQGGCTSTNDEVADTPAQSSPTNGCPTGRDSCNLPGLDPIHNYMDYSYDSCYNQYTPGQTTRMNQMWTAYRA